MAGVGPNQDVACRPLILLAETVAAAKIRRGLKPGLGTKATAERIPLCYHGGSLRSRRRYRTLLAGAIAFVRLICIMHAF